MVRSQGDRQQIRRGFGPFDDFLAARDFFQHGFDGARVARPARPALAQPRLQRRQFLLGDFARRFGIDSSRAKRFEIGVDPRFDARIGSQGVLDPALRHGELVDQNRAEIRLFGARRGAFLARRRGLASGHRPPGRSRKAGQHRRGFCGPLQHPRRPHQVKHALFAQFPAQRLQHRRGVQIGLRRRHRVQRAQGAIGFLAVLRQRFQNAVAQAVQQIGAAVGQPRAASLRRFGGGLDERFAQRRQPGARRRLEGRIVARNHEHLLARPFAFRQQPGIIGRRVGILALVHGEHRGHMIAAGHPAIGIQLGHLVFFGRDKKQSDLRPAEDAVGLGVMLGPVAVDIGGIDQNNRMGQFGMDADDRQAIRLAARGNRRRIGHVRRLAQPAGRQVARIAHKGDRPQRMRAAERSGRGVLAQQPIGQRAFPRAGSADQAHDRGTRGRIGAFHMKDGGFEGAQPLADGFGGGAAAFRLRQGANQGFQFAPALVDAHLSILPQNTGPGDMPDPAMRFARMRPPVRFRAIIETIRLPVFWRWREYILGPARRYPCAAARTRCWSG
ncbi:MAG: hypothetical protein BWZ10_02267 [candidate division BRC1 bacterium ADurb.BinA364]|nr:MAG: hypothetical protein BWZ10_02267 [candidate division BRC1 bacterium ADurb.BinA364]